MRKPVILAYDGSAESDSAALWAAHYVLASGAQLSTMIVADPNDWTLEAQEGSAAYRAEGLVVTATGVLASAGIPDPNIQIHHADVVKTLLRAAQDAEMVVLGAHGRGRLAGAFEGSISQTMSLRTPSPLVVVRTAATPASTRVVVGLDDDDSRRALEFALVVATHLKYSITVCHGTKTSHGIRDKFRKIDADDASCRAVDAIVAAAQTSHPEIPIEAEHSHQDPVDLLAGASEDAAIVVVGSRGHQGIRGWWARSVSREVLHRAACTVAVVS